VTSDIRRLGYDVVWKDWDEVFDEEDAGTLAM
jgi:hypothetical protein